MIHTPQDDPSQDDASSRHPCRQCSFYAHSPYVVCAVHPTGPMGQLCPDYEAGISPQQLISGGCGDWLPTPTDDLRCQHDGLTFWALENWAEDL